MKTGSEFCKKCGCLLDTISKCPRCGYYNSVGTIKIPEFYKKMVVKAIHRDEEK